MGCSVKPAPLSSSSIKTLSDLLESLDETIPASEARALSKAIFSKTQKLTQSFNLTSPPLFHNFLVNVGVREKGLCYDWSDAFFLSLSPQNYPSFTFHLIVSHKGKYWSEHNALVIVSKNGKIAEGILIDAWRNSGRLYFSKITDDKGYKWEHRKERCCKID